MSEAGLLLPRVSAPQHVSKRLAPREETLPRIGTAGWSIPKELQDVFDGPGTHLQRYARQLPAVEINSSFHRPHRPQTYKKWASMVPAGFRFSVKMPREISHRRKLVGAVESLEDFLQQATMLGDKLGVLLLQLPPSLKFQPAIAMPFFEALRARFAGLVACEPRNPSWFSPDVDQKLAVFEIARVAADPPVVPEASTPGAWRGLTYWRLHGSPRIYYSSYSQDHIAKIAATLRSNREGESWCIFDNTTSGAGTANALDLWNTLVEVSKAKRR
jgi:uncharacterized protein YecE (DUF72 family)